MTDISINGVALTLTDSAKRALSDALLAQVTYSAREAAAHVQPAPADDFAALFAVSPEVLAEAVASATTDGLLAQRMHGALWGYDAAEAQARWDDALHLATRA